MLYSKFPGMFSSVGNFVYHTAASVVGGNAPGFGQRRVVEVQ